MNKTLIHTAFALAFGTAAMTTHAANLLYGDRLTITAGVPSYDTNGNPAGVTSGSWFGCDCDGNRSISLGEKVSALSQGSTGIVIGMATSPGASHSGYPAPGDTNAIDAPYAFFGNTASDYTTIGITGSTTAGLNMSGWHWTWLGIDIDMGGGAWGTGFANGVGNFTWDGVYGHAYTLDYRAAVPVGDPSGFGGVGMAWHFEGTVAVVPEASTYAMMLAGLGLVGVAARRRRPG